MSARSYPAPVRLRKQSSIIWFELLSDEAKCSEGRNSTSTPKSSVKIMEAPSSVEYSPFEHIYSIFFHTWDDNTIAFFYRLGPYIPECPETFFHITWSMTDLLSPLSNYPSSAVHLDTCRSGNWKCTLRSHRSQSQEDVDFPRRIQHFFLKWRWYPK